MKLCSTRALRLAVLLLCFPSSVFAQRTLHWDGLQVTAHLDAQGTLQVAETHTMVFTGDWNGGERQFNIRPRQKLTLNGVYRDTGSGWQPLTEDRDLDSVDDYAWTDNQTVRWRSRLRTDPPFRNTTLRYELRYDLSGILQKNGDGFLLDRLRVSRSGRRNRSLRTAPGVGSAVAARWSRPQCLHREQSPAWPEFRVEDSAHVHWHRVPG